MRLTLIALFACTAGLAAQPPLPFVPPHLMQTPVYTGQRPTPPTAAPLLYLRLSGPDGMKVTLYRNGREHEYDAPCVVGVRPGFVQRIKLSGMTKLPAANYYPTLDVFGSLYMGNLRSVDFPAAVVFSEEDFLKVDAGGFLQKAIVLERPETAFPAASSAKQPFEFSFAATRNLHDEARERGQLLAFVQLGQRKWNKEDLVRDVVPGILLLPGEKVLMPPAAPPHHAWNCYPLVDPIVGVPHPKDLYCLPDGGDIKGKVGYLGGKLVGLDASDTVAEYKDALGRRKIAVSNRICLCVPRFVVLKQEWNPTNAVAVIHPGTTNGAMARLEYNVTYNAAIRDQRLILEQTKSQARPSSNVNILGTAVTASVANTSIKATLQPVRTLDGTLICEKSQPDAPLTIDKWPDKCAALVGDLVTFYLRYTNRGTQPITSVVVSDSLTPRFEYVPGTAQADRDALFSAEPNDEGSSVLRWEIRGALQPGETGIVRFQIRVR